MFVREKQSGRYAQLGQFRAASRVAIPLRRGFRGVPADPGLKCSAT